MPPTLLICQKKISVVRIIAKCFDNDMGKIARFPQKKTTEFSPDSKLYWLEAQYLGGGGTKNGCSTWQYYIIRE